MPPPGPIKPVTPRGTFVIHWTFEAAEGGKTLANLVAGQRIVITWNVTMPSDFADLLLGGDAGVTVSFRSRIGYLVLLDVQVLPLDPQEVARGRFERSLQWTVPDPQQLSEPGQQVIVGKNELATIVGNPLGGWAYADVPGYIEVVAARKQGFPTRAALAVLTAGVGVMGLIMAVARQR